MDDINVYLSYDQIELLISLVTKQYIDEKNYLDRAPEHPAHRDLQHHIDFLKLTQRDLLDAKKRLIADKPKK